MKQLFSISPDQLKAMQIADWGYTEKLEPTTYKEYLEWTDKGLHGPLNYLADHRKDIRESLSRVYPECQSSLVFLFDYSSIKKTLTEIKTPFKIASYTMGFEGQDYHFWIAEKLNLIGEALKIDYPQLEFKISLDIHPVLERDLAFRSGLGWFGKNSMLINKKHGSYTLIGSLLINQKLNLELPRIDTDHCGNCTRCIDACPTKAIETNARRIDSAKCISTFTIETFKDVEPPSGYPTETQEIFGCDICQEVCPWNSKPLKNSELGESNDLIDFFNRDLNLIISDIEEMSNKQFKTFFKRTSFERGGKRGLLKNLKHYLKT
jgi:epoxyqueuosine reductase